jgi:hypothetical protein
LGLIQIGLAEVGKSLLHPKFPYFKSFNIKTPILVVKYRY